MPISLRSNTDYLLDNLIIHNCCTNPVGICSCESIAKVNSYKYLGVVFDLRMRWTDHIECLKNNLRKYIFAFRRLSDILNPNEIRSVYYAYIQSLLTYGIVAWGGAYKTHLQPLEVVQKSILKVSFKKNKRCPTDTLFKETSLFPVRKLFIKSLLSYIFSHYNFMFHNVPHLHNTRYSHNVGINSDKLVKSTSITNPSYIAQVLFKNIQHNYKENKLFECNSEFSFKKKVNEWLRDIDFQEAESLILSSYRRRP